MNRARTLFHYLGILTFFVWGGLFLYFYLSGRIVNYLNTGFRIAALAGGLFMFVAGIFHLLTARVRLEDEDACCGHDHGSGDQPEPEETVGCCGGDHGHHHHHHDHHDHHHHGHDHHHVHEEGHHHLHEEETTLPGVLATFLILLAPLLATASLTRDEFTGEAIINKGLYSNTATASGADRFWSDKAPQAEVRAFTLADLEQQVDKSLEGNYLLDVVSLFYAAGDPELQQVLAGLPVETVGQILPEEVNNPDGRRLRLFRLFVECCAADARPLGLPVEFTETAPALPDRAWVKVTGRLAFPQEGGSTVSLIQVERIEEVEEPEERMVY